jgi:phosphoserine phosphatase
MGTKEDRVKVVLFDLGGTLVSITNSQIPHVMKRILDRCGIGRSLEEISHAWKEAEKGLDFRDLTKLLDAFWVEWNKRILRNLRIESKNPTLARFIATHWWDYSDISLYPDAEEVLPDAYNQALR